MPLMIASTRVVPGLPPMQLAGDGHGIVGGCHGPAQTSGLHPADGSHPDEHDHRRRTAASADSSPPL